MRGEGGSYLMD